MEGPPVLGVFAIIYLLWYHGSAAEGRRHAWVLVEL